MNFIVALFYLFLPLTEEPIDTFMLEGVDVVASIKNPVEGEKAFSSTTIGRAQMENRHIVSLKELSAIAPNFYQPDYGSRMTSSIYVRGFGSRIDQPVVGMNFDGVPVLNKNNYDFDFHDISSVEVIRGAQSTLYGRNTVGGTINVNTLSPLIFQGKRFSIEYGNANTIRAKASHYGKPADNIGWSASVYYSHSDGFFRNVSREEMCDGGDNLSARLRVQYKPTEQLSIDNAFMVGYLDEGGYAYRAYDTQNGTLANVSYNEKCSYRRFYISDGLTIKRLFGRNTLSSTTAYQYSDDRMNMDNDFQPLNYFTLGQYQKEHSITQELILKSSDRESFRWLGGLFAFFKHQRLDAPVHFKDEGINKLILKNANEHFFNEMGYNLEFLEDNFIIEDKFVIPTLGVALFGRVAYALGDFDFTAGLRVDYEYSFMNYNSYTTLNYRYDPTKEFTPLKSTFKGRKNVDALEFLPTFTLSYKRGWGNVYASVSRGFKAGGFNTQLFSDILQQKLVNDIMGSVSRDDASSTVYRPESSWNYELGTHLSPLSDGSLQIDASLFYIDCRNQQLTVFPPGESTGRMMSNAGKSYSCGAELAASYRIERFCFDASFGYTYARFKEYISGKNDYSGKFLPYAPRETVAVNVSYNIPVPRSFANFFVLNVGWNGIGNIYWDEANSLCQPFYGLLSASLVWEKGHFGASLWGKNLYNEKYNTFYFKSIGNNFFAQGKPLQFGVSFNVNL